MPILPKQYDVNDKSLEISATLLPEGEYIMAAKATRLKQTSKGGQMLEIDFEVLSGDHTNSYITERYNIVNASNTAVVIAFSQLAKLSKALGMQKTPADSDDFVGKAFVAQVKVEKGKPYTDTSTGEMKDGRDQNSIASYLPYNPDKPQVQEEKPKQEEVKQPEPVVDSSFDEIDLDDEIVDFE